MKVSHVVRRFAREQWGGTESVVYYLAKEFESQKCSSPVLTTSMFSREGVEILESVEVRRFSYVFPWFCLDEASKRKLEKKGGSPLSLSLLFFLFGERDNDIIHVHSLHRLGGIARTVARWRNIPYVVSLHGGCKTLPSDEVEAMKEPFKGKFEWGKFFGLLLGSRRVLQDADAIICVGKQEYDLMKKSYPPEKVHYQPNGVATEFFSKGEANHFREHFSIDDKRKIILCVSRIDPQKNQMLLLKAFAHFYENNRDYLLVLLGPVTIESYRQSLVEEASKLGVADAFLLIPGLPLEDPLLASAYKAAEFFVLPSHHEPFGIVILEAWASGLPVIAADVGGIGGFTTSGSDVLLFDDGSKEQLLRHMELLSSDSQCRSELASAGLDAVKVYDWSVIAQETLSLYRGLIEAKQKKGK